MKMQCEIKHLADCLSFIPQVAALWYENIGQKWIPDASIEEAKKNCFTHLQRQELPQTYVGIVGGQPVATCSLRADDGLGEQLTPWLGGLIVDKQFRNQGIGNAMIEKIKGIASTMGYHHLYLLTLDPTIPQWYAKLGWQIIGADRLYHHPVMVMQTHI